MRGKDNHNIREFRKTKLDPREREEYHLEGWLGHFDDGVDGQFVLTDRRACFYRRGLLKEVFEAIPLSKLTNIQSHCGMLQKVLTLQTATDELRFVTVEPRDLFERVCQRLEFLRDEAGLEPGRETESVMDQLKKLGELRDAGVLTEDEFAAQKAILVARM